MKTRRQQIFEACEALAKAGVNQISEFTYDRLHQALDTLDYPRGNAKYLKQYRNEWLSMMGVTTATVEPAITSSSNIDPLLTRLTTELHSELEKQLRDEYANRFAQAEAIREQAVDQLEDCKIDLNELMQQFQNLQHQYQEQQQITAAMQTKTERLIEEHAKIKFEHTLELSKTAALQAQVATLSEQQEQQLQAVLAQHHLEIAALVKDRDDLKTAFNAGTSALKEAAERNRHDSIVKIDQLQTAHDKLKSQHETLQHKYQTTRIQLEEQRRQHQALQQQQLALLEQLKSLHSGQHALHELVSQQFITLHVSLEQLQQDHQQHTKTNDAVKKSRTKNSRPVPST